VGDAQGRAGELIFAGIGGQQAGGQGVGKKRQAEQTERSLQAGQSAATIAGAALWRGGGHAAFKAAA
jgi:hypothetical protein